MCVDAHITGSAGQGFAFAVRNVLLRLGIAVLLGHAEINNMDDVGCLGAGTTDKKVVGFDVTIDEVLLVDCLDARQLSD
jgi:hypothetical protein